MAYVIARGCAFEDEELPNIHALARRLHSLIDAAGHAEHIYTLRDVNVARSGPGPSGPAVSVLLLDSDRRVIDFIGYAFIGYTADMNARLAHAMDAALPAGTYRKVPALPLNIEHVPGAMQGEKERAA